MPAKKYYRKKHPKKDKWRYTIKDIGGIDLVFEVDCTTKPWTITPISGVEVRETFSENILRTIVREEVSRALSSEIYYRKVEEEITVGVREDTTHVLQDVPSGPPVLSRPPVGMSYGVDHAALMDEVRAEIARRKEAGLIKDSP